MGSDSPMSEMFDAADKGIVEQQIRSTRSSMLQTSGDISVEYFVSTVVTDAQANLSTERIADPTQDLAQPNLGKRTNEGCCFLWFTL